MLRWFTSEAHKIPRRTLTRNNVDRVRIDTREYDAKITKVLTSLQP